MKACKSGKSGSNKVNKSGDKIGMVSNKKEAKAMKRDMKPSGKLSKKTKK